MTAQPHDFVPGQVPDPAKSLRAIRAALVVSQDRHHGFLTAAPARDASPS